MALFRGNAHGSDCLSIFSSPAFQMKEEGNKAHFQSNFMRLWSSNITETAQSPLLPFQLVSLGNEWD